MKDAVCFLRHLIDLMQLSKDPKDLCLRQLSATKQFIYFQRRIRNNSNSHWFSKKFSNLINYFLSFQRLEVRVLRCKPNIT